MYVAMCVLWLCAHACMCVHPHTRVGVCVHLHMHVQMHLSSCPHHVCLRMHHGCICACLCVCNLHCFFPPPSHHTLVARNSVHLTVVVQKIDLFHTVFKRGHAVLHRFLKVYPYPYVFVMRTICMRMWHSRIYIPVYTSPLVFAVVQTIDLYPTVFKME